MPSPVEAFPWGSRSTTRTRRPDSARAAPRFTAVVVLPTPPFWLAMAMIRGSSSGRSPGSSPSSAVAASAAGSGSAAAPGRSGRSGSDAAAGAAGAAGASVLADVGRSGSRATGVDGDAGVGAAARIGAKSGPGTGRDSAPGEREPGEVEGGDGAGRESRAGAIEGVGPDGGGAGDGGAGTGCGVPPVTGGGGHSGWASEGRTGDPSLIDPVDESMGLASGSVGTDGRSIAGSGRDPGASLELRIGAPADWAGASGVPSPFTGGGGSATSSSGRRRPNRRRRGRESPNSSVMDHPRKLRAECSSSTTLQCGSRVFHVKQ